MLLSPAQSAAGTILLAVLIAQSLRLSRRAASRAGEPSLVFPVWLAMAGTVTWAVTEGLSLAGALRPRPILGTWALVAMVSVWAAPLRQGAWPSIGRALASAREAATGIGGRAAVIGAGAILLVTLVVALVSPPNNWDSHVYHNARVMQWLDHGTVANYETPIDHQLRMPPLASYFRLHVYGLTGSDVLFNAVQWLSFLICVVEGGRIAYALGGAPAAVLASLLVATLPMAILQASTTQNDLVTAAYVIAAASAAVPLLRGQGRSAWLFAIFYACLGLAAYTKGTAYILATLLASAVTVILVRRRAVRSPLVAAAAGLVLVLALNFPHLWRSYATFGTPLPHPEAVAVSTAWDGAPGLPLKRAASQISRSVVNQLQVATKIPGLGDAIVEGVLWLHSVMGISPKDEAITLIGRIDSVQKLGALHEDVAGCTLHFLLAVAVSVAALAVPRRRRPPSAVWLLALAWACWSALAVAIKWQPWAARLQLPAMVLFCPPVAALLVQLPRSEARRNGLAMGLVVVLLGSAVPYLLFNAVRPLVAVPGLTRFSILTRSRWENLFNGIYPTPSRLDAVIAALPASCSRDSPVGLRIARSPWEYALWAAARRAGRDLSFRHVSKAKAGGICALVRDCGDGEWFCLADPSARR